MKKALYSFILIISSLLCIGWSAWDSGGGDSSGSSSGINSTPEAHGNQSGTLSCSIETYQVHSLTVTGNLAITTTGWTTATYQEIIYIIENGGAYTLTIDGLSFSGLKESGWNVVKIAKIDGTTTVVGGITDLSGGWS